MVVLPDSETNHGSSATKFIHAGLPEGHESPAEATVWYDQSRQLQEQVVDAHPQDFRAIDALSDTVNAIGIASGQSDQLDTAMQLFIRARDLRQQLVDKAPERSEYRRKLANSHMNVGVVEMHLENHEAAEAEFFRARDIRSTLDETTKVQVDMAMGLYNMAQLQLLQSDVIAAKESLQRARELFARVIADDPTPEHHYRLALCFALLTEAHIESLHDSHDHEGAMVAWNAANRIAVNLVGKNPDVPTYQKLLESLRELRELMLSV